MTSVEGVMLFAHGARDPRWAEPFARMRDLVAARLDTPHVVVAYLELMQPALDAAADALVAAGCERLCIIPVFLGQGSHLRRDLPERVDALRRRLPSVTVRVADAVGDDDAVVAAIADYCVRFSTTP